MSRYQLDTEELRARLNARRVARGMSWNALAIAAGVDKNVVSRLVKGRAPGADALVTLLVYLEIEASLVTRRTPEPEAAHERDEKE